MPLPTPTIRIRLTGLLVFYFVGDSGKQTLAEIGVHDKSKSHQLRISVHEVTAGDDGPTDKNAILEISRKLKGSDISIMVDNPDPAASGIILYPHGAKPFGEPASDRESPFELIPDIEGQAFHNTALERKKTQFIRLNNGVFYTMFQVPGWILRENGRVGKFTDVGIDVGVNIYLQDAADSRAVLKYGTKPEKTLELTKKKDTRYEIEILNDCPVPLGGDQDVFESDFKLYYDIVTVADPDDHFNMVFRRSGGGGLDRDHPCGAIRGSQSGG